VRAATPWLLILENALRAGVRRGGRRQVAASIFPSAEEVGTSGSLVRPLTNGHAGRVSLPLEKILSVRSGPPSFSLLPFVKNSLPVGPAGRRGDRPLPFIQTRSTTMPSRPPKQRGRRGSKPNPKANAGSKGRDPSTRISDNTPSWRSAIHNVGSGPWLSVYPAPHGRAAQVFRPPNPHTPCARRRLRQAWLPRAAAPRTSRA